MRRRLSESITPITADETRRLLDAYRRDLSERRATQIAGLLRAALNLIDEADADDASAHRDFAPPLRELFLVAVQRSHGQATQLRPWRLLGPVDSLRRSA